MPGGGLGPHHPEAGGDRLEPVSEGSRETLVSRNLQLIRLAQIAIESHNRFSRAVSALADAGQRDGVLATEEVDTIEATQAAAFSAILLIVRSVTERRGIKI